MRRSPPASLWGSSTRPIVNPLAMSSAIRAIEGGDFAHGLGDGAEVFTQDRTMVARDLRAHHDVRVACGHSIEAGAYPFLLITVASKGRPRSNHISHRDGDVVQHRAQLALTGDYAELDVAVGLLFGGHPWGQARRAQQRHEPAQPPKQLPDPLLCGLIEPVVRVRAVTKTAPKARS